MEIVESLLRALVIYGNKYASNGDPGQARSDPPHFTSQRVESGEMAQF